MVRRTREPVDGYLPIVQVRRDTPPTPMWRRHVLPRVTGQGVRDRDIHEQIGGRLLNSVPRSLSGEGFRMLRALRAELGTTRSRVSSTERRSR